jgi:predicted O-linked N-acetylglucosamine transferase (SPINDLY family)
MTTTCHGLWMGVPVVTLAGAKPLSRAGLSLLSTAGLPELVAESGDEYVQLAAELAGDPERRAALRATLREKLRASPLMDERRFAANVECAYRAMWRDWCEKQPIPPTLFSP